jgi:hypothetical protein
MKTIIHAHHVKYLEGYQEVRNGRINLPYISEGADGSTCIPAFITAAEMIVGCAELRLAICEKKRIESRRTK